jgi:ABC-type multidrug transport system fused ATPase/permease subunit
MQEAEQRSLTELVLPHLRRERKRLVVISAAAIVGGLAEATTLVLIAQIAFALASDSSSIHVHLGPIPEFSVSVAQLIVLSAVLVGVRLGLQLLQVRLGAALGADVLGNARSQLLRRYLAANWDLQSSQRDGRLQELMTSYCSQVAAAVTTVCSGGVAAFNLAAFLAIALFVNVVASVLIAILALGLALLLRPFRAAVRRRADRSARADLEFATGITEFAASLQEVRIYGVAEQAGRRIEALNHRSVALNRRRFTLTNTIPALYQGTALLLIVAALGIADAANFSGLASIGAVVLLMLRSLSYGQSVQGAIQNLHEYAPYLQMLQEEEGRYLAAHVERAGASISRVGELRFDDVSFEYLPGQPVLRNLTFTVEPGQIVGIVGPSGSGKSTLVQLLLRLREPKLGRVMVDGMDLQDVSVDSWYEHVTFVPQEPRLFADTISNNIRFYRDDVDEATIHRAAKLAHIHDDIEGWPAGYETQVGERGGRLSGGQRQRLCIARALVEEPDVVVFDEPTSALDVRSEALLRDTMAGLAPHKTVIVIAHRMSTLTICDRIMVLLDGEIQGFDSPARLEATNPFYREALQLSGMR